MAEENRRFADKFALRMPEGMREKIAKLAEANNRSMNAEIVARLEASFADERGVPDFVTSGRIDTLANDLEGLRAEVRALSQILKNSEMK